MRVSRGGKKAVILPKAVGHDINEDIRRTHALDALEAVLLSQLAEIHRQRRDINRNYHHQPVMVEDTDDGMIQ
jgi:hypothetical protein